MQRTKRFLPPMSMKIILAVSVPAILAVSVATAAMATESWQHVISSSVTPKNSETTILSVTASDNIPLHTAVLGGFAWFYASGPNAVFVAVTHNGVRDSLQNPNGWHAHNVQLGPGTSSSNACIIGLSNANVGLTIQGNTLNVNARNSELTGPFTTSAKAFTIVADPGCSVTGLGVVLS